jgi:hypothetical protein
LKKVFDKTFQHYQQKKKSRMLPARFFRKKALRIHDIAEETGINLALLNIIFAAKKNYLKL